MIVCDFYLHGALVYPDKADTPLVVDADAVLACPISSQCFQPVRGWYHQVTQPRRRHYTLQPHSGPSLDVRWKVTDQLSTEEPLSVIVPEAVHHT